MDETATTVTTLDGLGRLLRELRRRQARHHGGSPATYRDLAGLDRRLDHAGHGVVAISGTAGVGKPNPGI